MKVFKEPELHFFSVLVFLKNNIVLKQFVVINLLWFVFKFQFDFN